MAAFDHVILLLSFVFALALAHLLSRVAGLVQARERVHFSELLTLAIVNAGGVVYSNWLALWGTHNARQWDLWSISCFFALALTIYFICAMAAPELSEDGPIDMEAFYWRNRRLFYSLIVLYGAIGEVLVSNFSYQHQFGWLQFVEYAAGNVPLLLAGVLPLVVGARWAQWTGGIALFLYSVAVLNVFVPTLG